MPTSSAAVTGVFIPSYTHTKKSLGHSLHSPPKQSKIAEKVHADIETIDEIRSTKKTKAGGFFNSTACKAITAALITAIVAAAFIIPFTVIYTSGQSTQISTTTAITAATTTATTATTTSATTTSSTTSTTTTNLACGSTCVNQTTSISSRLAFWSFDSVTTDATGSYSASGITSPTYVTGWVGSGVSFNASNAQRFTTGNIPLNLRSFTIEFWFYATEINSTDYAFVGEYSAQRTDQCLFLSIHNQKLFFGFFGDDTGGSTIITINKWYHAAFVYDSTILEQYIYLNGALDSQSAAIGSFNGSSVPFTIGGATIGGSTSLYVYYSGIIDHVTVSSQAKSACEVYLDANLACYFPFASASSIVDSGPNFLTANNIGATAIAGRIGQALQFSSSLSYITINGISALKSIYTVFTISMWVNPTNITGGATLIHASTQSNGQGTCLVMWGLTSSGIVSVNVMSATNSTISATAVSPLPLNTWTHIAQRFSTTNGIRLYINGTRIITVSAATGGPVGPYAIIGASPASTSYCPSGSIVGGQFYGSVDEYHVFGVELSATDICRLANP